jgi:hypothetical protein
MSGMRRVALLVLGASFMSSAGVAWASQLVSSSPSLGSGSAAVAACQGGPLSVTLVPSYDSTLAAYVVGSVRIADLDVSTGACGSKEYSITLSGGQDDATLGDYDGVTPSTADGFSVDLSAQHIRATSVTSVHLAIAG